MNENERGDKNENDGRFVETAFTGEQVDEALRAEVELGVGSDPCGFVGDIGESVTG